MSAAAAAAAISTIAVAAAAAAAGLRPGLVDDEGAAAEIGAVEASDRGLRFFIRLHLDERESARTAGGHVAHHAHRFNRARLAEQILELVFSSGERQISDKQFATPVYSFLTK